MDRLTFIVEMTKALAWPATVVFLALALRKPIGMLLPLLRRLKYGDFEAEFAELVEDATEKAKALPAGSTADPQRTERVKQLVEIAKVSPTAAIVEAWKDVQFASLEAVKRHQLDVRLRNVAAARAQALLKAAIIDGEQFELFERLRQMRNFAAYGKDEISRQEAEQYISLSTQFADFLSRA